MVKEKDFQFFDVKNLKTWDTYYYITSEGFVNKDVYDSVFPHTERLKYGNVYDTDPTKLVDQRKLFSKFYQIFRLADGDISVKTQGVKRYSVGYDRSTKALYLIKVALDEMQPINDNSLYSLTTNENIVDILIDQFSNSEILQLVDYGYIKEFSF